MRILWIACLFAAAQVSYGQQPPNVTAQRDAMKKLEFLVGKWSGMAQAIRGPGEATQVQQQEDVQYKLDGLVLLVEGTGRDPKTGNVLFRALATISYDDAAGKYLFRAYNDGRYLDTELKVPGKGFEWGFGTPQYSVKYSMRLNEKGEWVEIGEATFGGKTTKTLEMTVRKQ